MQDADQVANRLQDAVGCERRVSLCQQAGWQGALLCMPKSNPGAHCHPRLTASLSTHVSRTPPPDE